MLKRLGLAVALSVTMGQAGAALHDRGGGMIYDDVLKITWLQDANYAKTSGHDADGRMSWANAKNWADNLVYGGFSDWRLPTILDTGAPGCDFANSGTDCGYNVQTYDSGTNTVYSELAYMYYVNLGLKASVNPDGTARSDWGIFGNGTCNGTDCNTFGQNDVGLIKNLQSGAYWSGTEFAPKSNDAWGFSTIFGTQSFDFKVIEVFAWAVRPGDVARVPVPGTLALLGLGLGLIGIGRARGRR
jgi:hypothetical protein